MSFYRNLAIVMLAAAIGLVSIGPADALTRLRGDLTSCAVIQQTIYYEGRVILRYPSKRVPNYFVFQHYVAGDRFCRWGEVAVWDRVRAADTRSCPVLKCEEYEPKHRFFRRRH